MTRERIASSRMLLRTTRESAGATGCPLMLDLVSVP
jgi:hypothetical protein